MGLSDWPPDGLRMIRRATRRPAGAEPLVTLPYALALRPAGDGAGFV
jgi:hypothetical protein